ncbi:MAG TPA: thiamine pyrophosphate-binding protein [Dehalococcoidia bacterium]|nr:thiamine pyrophosphate-binding protein [Dehalococcoidia bacterium]
MAVLGKHAVMQQLLAEGTKYVFGNPGSTELAFMDGLQDYPELEYILGLHETVPLAMADGYARATHKPAVVNVHIAPGLANAMSMIYNARKNGSPLVVTVGQQDTRYTATEPLLYADLVRFAEPWTKWVGEAHRADDIPMLMRRAFKIAAEPPQGPVVLSLPQDVLDGEVEEAITPTVHTDWATRPDPSTAARIARYLAEAENPIILCGDSMALSNAAPGVAALAELAGCPVSQTASRQWNFPTDHPLFVGPLGFLGGAKESLAGHDVIVAIGCGNPFMPLFYEGPSPIPDGAVFIQIDVDSWELAKNYAVTMSVLADTAWAARDVREALDKTLTPVQRTNAAQRAAAITQSTTEMRAKAQDQLRNEWDNEPISPMRLVAEVRDAVPADTAFVGSGGTSGRAPFAQLMQLTQPNSFFDGNASLGFPLPGTLGVKLALPDRPVVGLLREGDSMYSIQGLWTAAKYNIDVTYVVFNNASYRILKQGMVRYLGASERKSGFLGMNFGEPAINIAKQADVWDIPSARIDHPADLAPALKQAVGHKGPSVVDVVIDGSYGRHF